MAPSIIRSWIDAAVSGFAQPSDWQSWADARILALDEPPLWMLEMSLASDANALREIWMRADQFRMSQGDGDAVLGYTWWRYERGDFDLEDCLTRAGHFADASGASVDCEEFYFLLNRLEADPEDEVTILAEARSLFAPLRERARAQWERIQTYGKSNATAGNDSNSTTG